MSQPSFELEQLERTEDSQVLENDLMAFSLSEPVASMLCALVCVVITLQGSLFVCFGFVSVFPSKP